MILKLINLFSELFPGTAREKRVHGQIMDILHFLDAAGNTYKVKNITMDEGDDDGNFVITVTIKSA